MAWFDCHHVATVDTGLRLANFPDDPMGLDSATTGGDESFGIGGSFDTVLHRFDGRRCPMRRLDGPINNHRPKRVEHRTEHVAERESRWKSRCEAVGR